MERVRLLIQNSWTKTRLFLEMIKFEHSIFALPFAYLGLFLAERGWPRWDLFFWVTAAMVSFRTMAMGLNRLIDLPIDRQNPRTKNRALPAKSLKPYFVWILTGASWAIFELSAFQLGALCFKLSPIPVLLAWIYPWAKRFTWFSHLVLGIILGISPYGAWLASRGEFSWIPGLLTIGVAAWVAGFDIIYALQDEDFDRQFGLYSFPARFGSKAAIQVTTVLHFVTWLAWFSTGMIAGLGRVYQLGIVLTGIFLIREHWLVRSFGIKKVEEAFFTMNAIVSVSVFLAVVADFSLGKFFQ